MPTLREGRGAYQRVPTQHHFLVRRIREGFPESCLGRCGRLIVIDLEVATSTLEP